MQKPRILLISYHFYPSGEVGAKRPSETALLLSRAGFDITVVRATDKPRKELASIEPASSITLFSVRIPRKWISELWVALKSRVRRAGPAAPGETSYTPSGVVTAEQATFKETNWLRRQIVITESMLDANKLWILRCCALIVFRLRRGAFDAVVASGPPKASWVAGLFASKILKAPLVLDLRDPWYLHGDGIRTDPPVAHPLARLENRIGRACATGASRFVIVSPGMEGYLQSHYGIDEQRIELIRNGFDADAVITANAPTGKLELLYAGTLYLNRNPFPLLEALRVLLAQPGVERDKIRFRLIGNCDTWQGVSLPAWLDRYELGDVVRVSPPVPAAELKTIVEQCNVLINFSQGQPRQIPAKSYEYLASRRDVVTFAEEASDTAALFREAGVGYVADGSQESALRILTALYDKYVVRGAEFDASSRELERYSRAAQTEKFIDLLTSLASARHAPGAPRPGPSNRS